MITSCGAAISQAPGTLESVAQENAHPAASSIGDTKQSQNATTEHQNPHGTA